MARHVSNVRWCVLLIIVHGYLVMKLRQGGKDGGLNGNIRLLCELRPVWPRLIRQTYTP